MPFTSDIRRLSQWCSRQGLSWSCANSSDGLPAVVLARPAGLSPVGMIVVAAWVLPEIVGAFVWYAFLNPQGTLNAILGAVGLPHQDWIYTIPIFAVILAKCNGKLSGVPSSDLHNEDRSRRPYIGDVGGETAPRRAPASPPPPVMIQLRPEPWRLPATA